MNKLYPWQNELWQRWIGLRTRLPHALLLKGAQGIGKLDFTLILAQSLLCEKPHSDGLACESCDSCRWFEQGTHPDFRLLISGALAVDMQESSENSASLILKNCTRRVAEEALEEQRKKEKKPSKEITIDQVRTLNDFSSLSAHQGGFRVVLIHPAETMNANAANALLKTLEEPSGQMLFILVTHKPQQLPPTILSRCLTLAAPMPLPDASAAWLKQQGIDDPTALLAQAGFAPLQAERLAEEAAGVEEYSRFLQEIRQPAKFDVFALAEQLQRTEPAKVIHWLQQWCYDLGSAKLAGKVLYHPDMADAIKNIADKIAVLDLLRYQKELVVAKREASHPLNPKLLFESILLSYRHMMLGGAPR